MNSSKLYSLYLFCSVNLIKKRQFLNNFDIRQSHQYLSFVYYWNWNLETSTQSIQQGIQILIPIGKKADYHLLMISKSILKSWELQMNIYEFLTYNRRGKIRQT